MSGWSFDNIPEQTGRVAIVTGANSGIGFETASALARKGATVVLACRNLTKGADAVARIEALSPKGSVSLIKLDLSDLDSVETFVSEFSASHDTLDLLINNAGVMVPPHSKTAQGFELQIGTNHIGHFALTLRLLPLLQKTKDSRVVVVSSMAHKFSGFDVDDLDFEQRGYNRMRAYAASKAANLLFAFELQRRLDASDGGVTVTAAHPGWTATDLQRTAGLVRWLNPLFAMKPADGALPTLRAATDPQAEPASYWGPSGLGEMRGPPKAASIHSRVLNKNTAAKLWAVTEQRTGLRLEHAS